MFNFAQDTLIQSQIRNFQNDLLDNVKYAVNIQSAILPTEQKLKSHCKDSFIIYKPQKYVSGDFYWLENNENKLSLILGDSTGHGVSASYISIIVLSALEALKENEAAFKNPKMVLEYLNNHLYNVLKKDKGSCLFESAEMASLNIDFNEKILTYASAGISVISYRNGEIHHLHKNKTSVGASQNESFKIDHFVHHLIPGERIFVMSDGFKDQHGGERGKKLGTRKLLSLLVETSFLSCGTQKNIIESFLKNWKNDYDQTDDISLIGITIPGSGFLS